MAVGGGWADSWAFWVRVGFKRDACAFWRYFLVLFLGALVCVTPRCGMGGSL